MKKGNNELSRFFKSVDPRKVILLSHDPPYGTKLDLIRDRRSPRYGEHLGDFVIKKFAKKYQPLFWACGNIHESRGIARLEKTVVANTGYGHDGYAALIELPKLRVKMVKI